MEGTAPTAPKNSQGQMLIILLMVAVVLVIGGFFVYRRYSAMPGAGLTTGTAIQPQNYQTGDPSLDKQLISMDQDITALDKDLSSVDQSMSDKPGDLSE